MKNGERFRFASTLPIERFEGELWHQFPRVTEAGREIAPLDFNPVTRARFSLRYATPRRAMYYAGTRPEVALFESMPLRELLPVDGEYYLEVVHYARQSLAHLRTRRPLNLVNLGDPHVRKLVPDASWLECYREMRHRDGYVLTRAFAAAIMATPGAADCDGLRWPSRQCSKHDAVLLFAPRVRPEDLELLGVVDLDASWTPVDDALRTIECARYSAGAVPPATLAEDDAIPADDGTTAVAGVPTAGEEREKAP